jgi:hypothetical protein
MSLKLVSLCVLAFILAFADEFNCHSMHPKIFRLSPGSHSTIVIPGDDQNPERWLKSAKETLEQVLAKKRNNGLAKNVILFLGDGMGMTTVTAGRIYKGQQKGKTGEEELTFMEQLSDIGLSKVNFKLMQSVSHSLFFSYMSTFYQRPTMLTLKLRIALVQLQLTWLAFRKTAK